ncbi:MAG: type III pantothenate kinase [Gammaproteobacteria bacterium]|nr:type III pantothenate kinase [Gammaproteobacteria bacterium]NND54047.1 type III pantothenate kinase [Gammaproteobacteria bacterium]
MNSESDNPATNAAGGSQLLLDIGNTRIKWAFDGGDELTDAGELMHRGQPEALDEFPAALARRPDTVTAINVAGAAIADRVTAALRAHCDVAVQFLQVSERCGDVTNGYTEWQQLGADRWAAVVGAWHELRSDALVVDAGTAVTIDLLRADGRHQGGLILPGLHLAEQVLGVSTADIANFAAEAPGPGKPDWFGCATAEAVQRGARFSLCAAIDRAVAEFPSGAMPPVLLTGGDAAALQPGLRSRSELRPLLVLEGVKHLQAEASAGA